MRDLAFCRQLPLYRDRLSTMLRSVAQSPEITDDAIAEVMGVNPYAITGYRGWFRKTGLGEGVSGNYKVTPFGALLAEHDPGLQQAGTQWLLHYYLVSQHEERAEVWYRCFNEFLTSEQSFSAPALQEYVLRSLEQTPSNKDGVAKDIKELIKTYTNSAALGELGLLVRQGKSDITVGLANTPDPLIVAYVLFDSWEQRFGAIDTIRLGQLVSEPETIGRVFLADSSRVRRFINSLQSLGLVTFADTQHEPVTRRFQESPIALLVRYYHHL